MAFINICGVMVFQTIKYITQLFLQMNFSTFLKLEVKKFLSGQAVFAALLCIGLAAVYAVYQGGNAIEKQMEVVSQTPNLQSEHTDKMLRIHKGKNLGDVLYYHYFYTFHEPGSWASFSVGQSDVNSFNIRVRILTLEGQIYNSELTNPTNLLFGNFDLSFVIVFLFPLIIIVFTHNLISEEQESETWNLLRSQPVSVQKILGFRIALRFLIVLLTAILVISTGCLALGADFDARFLYSILLTCFYFAFWFGISIFVISFGKGTTFNALTLLGVWIFLVLLAPALLSSIVASAYPMSESMETTIKQRDGYHNKWDKPKNHTMEKFYKKYPQFSNIKIPEDKFSWGWYYAMQEMGDFESSDSAARYADKLARRQDIVKKVSWFLPTVNTQLQFNKIASTDLNSHLKYLDSVRNYHTQIRTTYYPYIFRDANVLDVDLTKPPTYDFKAEPETNIFNSGLIAMIILSFLIVTAAIIRLNSGNY